jgi:uncharacterized protein (TIGR03086 family)
MELRAALSEVTQVMYGVRPDQLDGPTPCAAWDVRALMSHVRQVVAALRLAGSGQPVPGDLWERDLPAAGFDEDADAAAAAWARPGAGDGTESFGTMAMPATVVEAMLVSDLAIHGWTWHGRPGSRTAAMTGSPS